MNLAVWKTDRDVNRKPGLVADIDEALVEIDRLQQAKRRALAVADERSKENVTLRAALEKIAAYSPASTVQPVAIAREALGKSAAAQQSEYTRLFNAIAAAVHIEGDTIAISVNAFNKAFGWPFTNGSKQTNERD